MSLAQLLLALATPLARRVMIALGLVYVTYEGLSSMVDSYLTDAAAAFLGVNPDVLAILQIAGLFDGVSLLTGAIIARVAMAQLTQIIPDVGNATTGDSGTSS